MRFAAAFSTRPQLSHAVDEVVGAVTDELDANIDLAFVFLSASYINGDSIDQLSDIAARLADQLGTENIIGCSGESVIANQYELELPPALSLWVGSIPKLQFDSCHLAFHSQHGDAGFAGWTDELTGDWPDNSTVFTFGDPFSFPMDVLLQRMNEDRSGTPILGGMASGCDMPGAACLILGDRVYDHGAVLVRVHGDFVIDPVVSQGCRPIGEPLVITKSERNEIRQLGGKPALDQLQAIFQTLPQQERLMVNKGLHVGRVVSEYIEQPKQGDFLIRNVVQIDEQSGMIVIGDFVRTGQTMQFQIRDHESAAAELKHLLSRLAANQQKPEAAVVFNCNGRGTRLFPIEHHDTLLIREVLGPIPVSGFFAAGEIGPIGDVNFLHGFTSSMAVFREL